MELALQEHLCLLHVEQRVALLFTCLYVLLVLYFFLLLDLLTLFGNGFYLRIQDLDILLELSKSLGLKFSSMQEGHLVLSAVIHVLFSELGGLVLILLDHGLEGTLLIDVLLDLLRLQFYPHDLFDESLVLREQTHRQSGCDHDIRSLGYLLSINLLGQLLVVDPGGGVERLFLQLNIVLVWAFILGREGGVVLHQVHLFLLVSLPFGPGDFLPGIEFVLILFEGFGQMDVPVLGHDLLQVVVDQPLVHDILLRGADVVLILIDHDFLAKGVQVFE